MFELKAGTQIQVYAPFGVVGGTNGETKNGIYSYDHGAWKDYTAKADTLYEKEDVFDAVALHNGREMPLWVARNIELGYTVVRNGKYWAMVRPSKLIYLD